jgi:VWFA-related protein
MTVCLAALVATLVATLGEATDAGASLQQQKPPEPPAQGAQQLEPGQSIVRTVDLVNVVFAVLNRRNRFVTDLEQKEFRVFEDGKPQEIRNFSRETNLPLRIGLLLDTSNSIRDRLQFEQEAAIDFLAMVLRRHKDLAFLMTFDSEPQLIHEFTADVSALAETIKKQRAGGATTLYDAVYEAAGTHMARAPLPAGDPSMRRVLVVISDGFDSMPSQRLRSEAIELAQRNDVAIYTISTSTDWMSVTGSKPEKYHYTEGDKVLITLAEETGGRAFFPFKLDDLGRSFLDISDELRSQYSLAYTPTNRSPDGKFRSIKIETERKGLIVRGRKGYFAPRGPAVPSRPSGQQ